MLMTKYTVVALRAELDITQAELADESKVDQGTISNLEGEKPVRARTAYKVWYAINRLRQVRGLAPLAFDDISWKLM